MPVTGLGPHGERAATPDRLALTPAEADAGRRARANITVVRRTTTSVWACQQLAGVVKTLGTYGAAEVEITCADRGRRKRW